MSDVYVLGVDMIKFGRFPDRSVPNIGAEAALMALDDAGLNHLAVDEIFPARTGQISIGKGSGAYNQIVQFIDQILNDIENI